MGAASDPGAASDAARGVLEARGITKSFGDRLANDHVDLTVHRGEIRALLGENGAGKTTLISVLCGQYQPDGGLVTVHGRTLTLGSPRAALQAGIGDGHPDVRLGARVALSEIASCG